MPDWVTSLIGGSGGVGIVWAAVALYRARNSRPITNAKALDSLAKTAAEMVASSAAEVQRIRLDAETHVRRIEAEIGHQLGRALQDVDMARREATEARQAAQQAERMAEKWYRQMADEAYRPSATVERWRELVSSFPPNVMNGASMR